MATKSKLEPIKAWSYSRYSCYKQCPFLFKCKYVDKLPEPTNPAMQRGNEVHKEAENYLKHNIKAVPPSLKKLEIDFKKLRKKGAVAEEQWGITREWTETGYFSSDVWLRLKVDSCNAVNKNTLNIIDFKTGKIRDGYEEQLELYATVTFSIFEVDTITTELWYVDHGVILGRSKEEQDIFKFTLGDHEKLIKLWEGRVRAMLNDTRYTPTPNYACQWCHFSKAKGGPCKF